MNSIQISQDTKKIFALMAVAVVCIGISVGTTLRLFAQRADPDFRPARAVPAQKPITSFPTRPVREVQQALNPSELVLGVTVGTESRAYPINMLTGPSREILNDTLGGRPIAATW